MEASDGASAHEVVGHLRVSKKPLPGGRLHLAGGLRGGGFDAVFRAVRGALVPDRPSARQAMSRLLAGRACERRVEQTLGRLAQVNGILFGRVSALERNLGRNGREVTYRFVWELSNTQSGVLDIAHEEKIRKNVR